MYRIAISLLIGLVVAVINTGPAFAKSEQAASAMTVAKVDKENTKGPKAVFPEMTYKFEPVTEGVKIKHDFIVENHGNAPLVIKNIRPD